MIRKRLDRYCLFWRIMGGILCAGSAAVFTLIIKYIIAGGLDLFLCCLLIIPVIVFATGLLFIYLSVKLVIIELEYRGYEATAQLSLRNHTYYGTLINSDIPIEGESLTKLSENFSSIIDKAEAEVLE